MGVTLINGNGNEAVYAEQDSDWYAALTENTTAILKTNGNLAATIVDESTIQIASGVCVSKEGRRVQIDTDQVEEITIPTGSQGVDTYYIIGFHLYVDESGNQVAETFCETMASASATITEETFKGGATSVYVSLYRVKREGVNLASVSRICPLMDLPSHYIAEHEAGTTASKPFSVGEYFTNNGAFKKATSAISQGDTISSSNTEETTVAEELTRIITDLSEWEDVTSEFTQGITFQSLMIIHNKATKTIRLMGNATGVANSATWLTIPSKYSPNADLLAPSSGRKGFFGHASGRFAQTASTTATYFGAPLTVTNTDTITVYYPISQTCYALAIYGDYIYS